MIVIWPKVALNIKVDGFLPCLYYHITVKLRWRGGDSMKVKIHFSDGSSRIIDFGEVPDIIVFDNEAITNYIMRIFVAQGIDPHNILTVETISDTLLN